MANYHLRLLATGLVRIELKRRRLPGPSSIFPSTSGRGKDGRVANCGAIQLSGMDSVCGAYDHLRSNGQGDLAAVHGHGSARIPAWPDNQMRQPTLQYKHTVFNLHG